MAVGAAVLYTLTGFGFAVLSVPAFLLLLDPPQAIQLVIIISTALSFAALRGLWRAITPALLLRLALGRIAPRAHRAAPCRSALGPPADRSRDPGVHRSSRAAQAPPTPQ